MTRATFNSFSPDTGNSAEGGHEQQHSLSTHSRLILAKHEATISDALRTFNSFSPDTTGGEAQALLRAHQLSTHSRLIHEHAELLLALGLTNLSTHSRLIPGCSGGFWWC